MSNQEEQGEQLALDLLTFDDQVKREVLMTLARRQLVNDNGVADTDAIADLVYPVVSAAVVKVPADRATVAITPVHLMEEFFSEIPGPSDWVSFNAEEALFRQQVWEKVRDALWRVLSTDPDGPVQSKLARNGGMVLCRTSKRHPRPATAYVTQNRKCIAEDNNDKAMARVRTAQAKADALAEMAMERVPEAAAWFERRVATTRREIQDTSKNRLLAAREAVDVDDEIVDADDVIDGDE